MSDSRIKGLHRLGVRARVDALGYAAEHGDAEARAALEAAYDDEVDADPIDFDRVRELGRYVRNTATPDAP